MPRKILAKSTHNSRNFQTHAAGGKINFCSKDLIALSVAIVYKSSKNGSHLMPKIVYSYF